MRRSSRLQLRLVASLAAAVASAGCNDAPKESSSRPPVAQKGNAAANLEQSRLDTSRAFELLRVHDYDRARRLLSRAIAADPMYGPSHNDLGLVLYHDGRNYEAAWEFERASKLMPRNGEPLNNLGLVYERVEKRAEAEAAFVAAFDLDPSNVEFAGNLARARVRRGERDETTRTLLQLILAKDTRPAWTRWARATLYRFAATTAPAAR